MDWNHDQINDAQQHYSNIDITSISDFVQQASSNDRNNIREDNADFVDSQTLNKNQKSF